MSEASDHETDSLSGRSPGSLLRSGGFASLLSLEVLIDVRDPPAASNIMFIETICSDAIVEKNIRAVKLQSPDVGCSRRTVQIAPTATFESCIFRLTTKPPLQYKGWNPDDVRLTFTRIV